MEENKPTFFNQIANVADEVFFTFDIAANRLKYLGPAFEKVWEMPVDDVLGNPHLLLQTIHPEDRAYAIDCFNKSKNSSKANRFELRVLCPNNVTKYILIRISQTLMTGKLLF